jgi:hypothetical protein
VSAVLEKNNIAVRGQAEEEVHYEFHCPGCKGRHSFRVQGPEPRWHFDGNRDKPTFVPSLAVSHGDQPGHRRCHLFVRAGQIQYLSDCTHELAGQTVPMVLL